MSKSLTNGQSEIDTVVLRLPDYDKEIRNWSRYSFNQEFMTPTAGWDFTVDDADTTLTSQLLVPGARVQLVINNAIQCSGFIDIKTTDGGTAGGTSVTVRGRDILGPVVSATMDPAFHFAQGITVPALVATVLAPFGITTIYNSDLYNIYVMSGYSVGSGKGQATVVQKVIQESTISGGVITLGGTATADTVYTNSVRPDLHALKADQIKPHSGEGCFQYLERLLRRLGLMLWAMADGSGVVIDVAAFDGKPQQKLTRKLGDPSQNNVKHGNVVENHLTQPSCIVAQGRGGGISTPNSAMRIVMINELTGLDDQGNPLPAIQDIITRYKSAKLLAVRPQLVPFQRPLGDQLIAKPFFLKDDESTSLAQLEAFTRRAMANKQREALTASYEVVGHTFNGHPWCVNTTVTVEDEVCGVDRDLWVVDKTFAKSKTEGTTCQLKLILPYTFQVAA